MIKQILLSMVAVFLFTACSFKMPSFLSFDFFGSTDYTVLLDEANKCQEIENEATKLDCYKKIENTNSFAQIRLGTYWADKKDYKSALKYLNQAKNNDNIYANLPLSFLYYKGEGVEKDLNKSFELLQKSSDIDPTSAYQLSRFYLQGINTKVDNEKGVELLEFAALQGVLEAQKMLVNTYKNGLFKQPRDQVKVDFWQKKIKENKEDINRKIYIL
ncbi:tetratricopeptide repeat protein [Aliarcobacter butzleri]|uniref:Beta-lactamase n=1 Tax=bioreactor metagenome TaxID=1076179 RepID=A0A644UIM4_9ZZZZ|nr:tetratricopeptide repeat protein [Aliarcobacter butzleri]QDM02110.1 sel1 repeat family protein [Aliarcobacter butzleri]BAK71755.1 conserved hypothetical protein [Aliarcobacter butzleri ED-1]